jgi:hypothetical protein
MASYHDLRGEERKRYIYRRPSENPPDYTRQMFGLIIAAAAIVALIAMLSFASSENSTRIEPSSSPPVTAPN